MTRECGNINRHLCGLHRERWQRYSSEEKAGQVLNVVGKLVNEAEDLQETMETRKRQLLLANGLEWRTFRSYVDIACMYMVSCLRGSHIAVIHMCTSVSFA